MGAGSGQAGLDYLNTNPKGAEVVAITVEDESDKAYFREPTPKKFHYKTGRFLDEYRYSELGRFDVITDVYGAVSYAPQIDEVFLQMAELLKVGGAIFTLIPVQEGTREERKHVRNTVFAETGQVMDFSEWFGLMKCLKEVDPPSDRAKLRRHTVKLVKTCDDVRVPELRARQFDGQFLPPTREYAVTGRLIKKTPKSDRLADITRSEAVPAK